MTFYLAARYSRREELCGYAKELTDAGHRVTSRWLKGEHLTNFKLAGPEAEEESKRFAVEDWIDLMACNCVITFTDPTVTENGHGGRDVKFGAAMASLKRCLVVGHREHVFHYMPLVNFYPTWAEARATLIPPA